jgi:hypothetical protein
MSEKIETYEAEDALKQLENWVKKRKKLLKKVPDHLWQYFDVEM